MATKRSGPAIMRSSLGLCASLAFVATVQAASLGRLTVSSAFGQALRAEVEVANLTPQEAGTVSIRLAPVSAFRAANLEFNPALSSLRFVLDQKRPDAAVVRISSTMPVNEPYLDLLLELSTASGRVVRQYTVLLDPPALKREPDVVAPGSAASSAGIAAPAQASPAAAVQAPPPAEAATPRQQAPGTQEAGANALPPREQPPVVTVRSGQTLSEIARASKPAAISLDQMMVALVRANPHAFAESNMNRLLAGSSLRIPTAEQAAAVDDAQARRDVVAQSRDFADYRSRLGRAAVLTTPSAAAAAGRGGVTAAVEDKAAPTGDRLKIAATEGTGADASATRAADEAVARERQLKELQQRIEQLEQTNAKLQQALELQSRIGAQAQQAAEPAKGPGLAAAPPAEKPLPQQASEGTPAKPQAREEVAKSAPPAPDAAKAAPKAAPVRREEAQSLFESLWENSGGAILSALAAILTGAIALVVLRRRAHRDDADKGLDSVLGDSALLDHDDDGQPTAAAFTAAPGTAIQESPSDPVAEAEAYIAYGRDVQAEEILREAIRRDPDHVSARVKLLEIYARRGDKAAFNALAEQIRSSVGVAGETWQQVTRLGQDLDSRAGGGNTTELTLGAGLLSTSFEELRKSSGVGGTAQTPPSAEPGVQPVVAHPVLPDGTIAFEGPEIGAGPAMRAGDGVPPPDLARMPNLDLDLSIGPDVSPTPAPPVALEIPAVSLTLDEALPAPASQADPGVDASEPIARRDSEAAPTTEVSSIVAAEMATKLDLARGYVDLGVKDGARELLAEVQRGGTPEQRAAALELLRRIG